MKNPSAELYKKVVPPSFEKGKVALLCIDLQYYDAAPQHGFFKYVDRSNPCFEYYFDRLENLVFPNVAFLQKRFRELGHEVIHVKLEAYTQDGREYCDHYKSIGFVPKGSKSSEFIPSVAPLANEIVMPKICSGAFNSTALEYVLHNMGIDQVVCVGVLTNECVDTTVRGGSDRGFTMYLVEDATATFTHELQSASITSLQSVYGFVMSTDQVSSEMDRISREQEKDTVLI